MAVSTFDPALFSKYIGEILCGVICLYADNFLWTGTESSRGKVIDTLVDVLISESKVTKAFKYNVLNFRSKYDVNALKQIHCLQSLNPITFSLRGPMKKSLSYVFLLKMSLELGWVSSIE